MGIIRGISHIDQYLLGLGKKTRKSPPSTLFPDIKEIFTRGKAAFPKKKVEQIAFLRTLVLRPQHSLDEIQRSQIVSAIYRPGLVLMGELKETTAYSDLWKYYTGEGLETNKKSVIKNEYQGLIESGQMPPSPPSLSDVQKAIREALQWKPLALKGEMLIDTLTYTEIHGVIRQMMKWVIFHDPFYPDYNPHVKTNALANHIALEVLKGMGDLSLKDLFKVRTRAGVVDFNSPKMQEQYQIEGPDFIRRMLLTATEDAFIIDHFSGIEKLNEGSPSRKIVWFHDNNGEAVVDLAIVMRMLRENRNLTVTSVPKRIQVSNDFSIEDYRKISKDPYFQELLDFHAQGRFNMLETGPEIQGVDLSTISSEVACALLAADVAVFIGQANFEMTNAMNPLPRLAYRIYNLLVKGFTLQTATGIHMKAGKDESAPMVLACVSNGDTPVLDYPANTKRIIPSVGKSASIQVAGRTLWEYLHRAEVVANLSKALHPSFGDQLDFVRRSFRSMGSPEKEETIEYLLEVASFFSPIHLKLEVVIRVLLDSAKWPSQGQYFALTVGKRLFPDHPKLQEEFGRCFLNLSEEVARNIKIQEDYAVISNPYHEPDYDTGKGPDAEQHLLNSSIEFLSWNVSDELGKDWTTWKRPS